MVGLSAKVPYMSGTLFVHQSSTDLPVSQVPDPQGDGIARLAGIGEALDKGREVRVLNGGTVVLGTASPLPSPSDEEEVASEGDGTGRPAARQGQGSAGRPRSAGGSAAGGAARPDSQILGAAEAGVSQEMLGVETDYPQLVSFSTPGMTVLRLSVRPIMGLPDEALIVAFVPNNPRIPPAAWAWWSTGLWIGERHTNYWPQGSICAYEPEDGTWFRGRRITRLLDLHVVWVVRHLHLKRLGRWPGPQVLHTAFERLNEQSPGELCAGCESGQRYEQCCYELDREPSWYERFKELMRGGRQPRRFPPSKVVDWLTDVRGSSLTPADIWVAGPPRAERFGLLIHQYLELIRGRQTG